MFSGGIRAGRLEGVDATKAAFDRVQYSYRYQENRPLEVAGAIAGRDEPAARPGAVRTVSRQPPRTFHTFKPQASGAGPQPVERTMHARRAHARTYKLQGPGERTGTAKAQRVVPGTPQLSRPAAAAAATWRRVNVPVVPARELTGLDLKLNMKAGADQRRRA